MRRVQRACREQRAVVRAHRRVRVDVSDCSTLAGGQAAAAPPPQTPLDPPPLPPAGCMSHLGRSGKRL